MNENVWSSIGLWGGPSALQAQSGAEEPKKAGIGISVRSFVTALVMLFGLILLAVA